MLNKIVIVNSAVKVSSQSEFIVFSIVHLNIYGPIHTSCCCRAKPIIIRCGTSTAFFMFDSYVEPNLSNLITNQAKIAFVCGKMTGALNEELLERSHNELEIYQD